MKKFFPAGGGSRREDRTGKGRRRKEKRKSKSGKLLQPGPGNNGTKRKGEVTVEEERSPGEGIGEKNKEGRSVSPG